ncbi:hypothetical protein HMPREF9071_0467 [Capnocytophaga sp. oral taxon 338 str. F0234]|nr:hypothetical protein HMPREF9071_0467 [Capnocytophaga sp. oral taxon 338 str. F0234]
MYLCKKIFQYPNECLGLLMEKTTQCIFIVFRSRVTPDIV